MIFKLHLVGLRLPYILFKKKPTLSNSVIFIYQVWESRGGSMPRTVQYTGILRWHPVLKKLWSREKDPKIKRCATLCTRCADEQRLWICASGFRLFAFCNWDLPVPPWASHLVPLCLKFLICIMWELILLDSLGETSQRNDIWAGF